MASNSEIWIKIFCEAEEAAKQLNLIATGVESMGKKVSSVGHSIGGVFDPMMKAVTGGVAAISAVMTAVGVSAVGVGTSYETQMTIVQNKSKATAKEMEKLMYQAEAMGEALPLSTSEIAEGYTLLAGRGLSAKEMMDAIEPSVALSIIQNYELAEATDAVGSAINQFSLGWGKAGEVVDIFTNTVNSSASGMEDLQLALSYVGKDAASVGLSLAETAAMIGKLADSGIRGSRSGTSLRMMLAKLQKPTTEATAVLKKYGIELESSPGKMKPVIDILSELNKKHLTGAEQMALFGVEAKTSAGTLMGAANSLRKYSKELEKVGDTQKQLNKMLKSTENIMASFKSATEGTLIVVFDGIQERVNNTVAKLSELVKAFNEWLGSTEGVVEGGNKVKMMLDAFVEGLQLPITSVEDFKNALKSIDVEKVAGKFKSFGEGVHALTTQLSSLVSKIPWKFLIENLETIVTVIVSGWATGKILIVIGNIGLFATGIRDLGKAFIWLKAEALVPLVTWMQANPVVVGLVAISMELTSIWNSLQQIRNSGKFEESSIASAERMEEIARDYTDALNGNAEALEKLPPKYHAMALAALDAKEKAEESARGMINSTKVVKDTLIAGLAQITQSTADNGTQFKNAINLYGDSIRKLIEEMGGASEDVTDKFMEGLESLPADVAKLMRKVVDHIRLSMVEIKQVTEPEKKLSWGTSVSQGIDKAIKDLKELGVTAKKQSSILGESFGLSAKDVDEAFNEKMVGAAKTSIKALEKQFKNPLIGKAFIARLREVGKSSGVALLKEVADALEKADGLMSKEEDWTGVRRIMTDLGREQESKSIKDSIDTGKMVEVSRYFDEIKTKWIDGNKEITQTFNSSTGLISRTSQTVLVDLKKQAEEARQEAEKNRQTEKVSPVIPKMKPMSVITDVTDRVEKVSDALVSSIDKAMNLLSTNMVNVFTLALSQMVVDANAYGTTIGDSLYTNIMSGVNRTVTDAKAKLKTIGGASGGMDSGLARSITEQGSDL